MQLGRLSTNIVTEMQCTSCIEYSAHLRCECRTVDASPINHKHEFELWPPISTGFHTFAVPISGWSISTRCLSVRVICLYDSSTYNKLTIRPCPSVTSLSWLHRGRQRCTRQREVTRLTAYFSRSLLVSTVRPSCNDWSLLSTNHVAAYHPRRRVTQCAISRVPHRLLFPITG